MVPKYSKLSDAVAKKFVETVGQERAFSNLEVRWTYAFGGSIFEKDWVPDLVLMPQTAEQVSEILKLANYHKIPVTPRGSGTSLSAGCLCPYGGIVLDMSQMNKILSIDVENNLVEVEPGVICDDLNEKLKPYSYFFPPDPGSSSVATIGGMVATNAGGIQAFKYGVTKDYALYLEVVLPSGEIVELGSKVLKSVSSYNLKDLFVGSEGTLGVVTKVGLKIRPLPKKRKLGLFVFETVDAISEAVKQIRRIGVVPNLLEFMDKLTTRAVFDYLGGEFSYYPKEYTLIGEVDGSNDQEVEENFTIMFDAIMQRNPTTSKIANTPEEREKLIGARKAALPALSRISPSCCIEDCTVQITHFSEAIKKIEAIPKALKIPSIKVATFGHMEGNLHPTFLFNENDDKDKEAFELAIDYLYKEIIIPMEGAITGEHGIGKVKTPFLALAHGREVVELMSGVKKMFDPNGILNPGMGKGGSELLKKKKVARKLKNQEGKVLSLNCMRCGFCVASCPSKMYFKNEAYSPRGRLSIINGLAFGDIILPRDAEALDILHACTLCGACRVKCPAGVETFKIFEKVREIIHK